MFTLGANGNIYLSSATIRATWPTSGAAANLSILKRVADVKVGLDKGEDDSTTRDTNGWETSFGVLKKADITVNLKKDSADAGYRLLLANYLSNSGATIPVAVLDGASATDGTEGLWADFEVFKFEVGQTLKGMQTVDVTLKPALDTINGTNAIGPEYIRVGTGKIG